MCVYVCVCVYIYRRVCVYIYIYLSSIKTLIGTPSLPTSTTDLHHRKKKRNANAKHTQGSAEVSKCTHALTLTHPPAYSTHARFKKNTKQR